MGRQQRAPGHRAGGGSGGRGERGHVPGRPGRAGGLEDRVGLVAVAVGRAQEGRAVRLGRDLSLGLEGLAHVLAAGADVHLAGAAVVVVDVELTLTVDDRRAHTGAVGVEGALAVEVEQQVAVHVGDRHHGAVAVGGDGLRLGVEGALQLDVERPVDLAVDVLAVVGGAHDRVGDVVAVQAHVDVDDPPDVQLGVQVDRHALGGDEHVGGRPVGLEPGVDGPVGLADRVGGLGRQGADAEVVGPGVADDLDPGDRREQRGQLGVALVGGREVAVGLAGDQHRVDRGVVAVGDADGEGGRDQGVEPVDVERIDRALEAVGGDGLLHGVLPLGVVWVCPSDGRGRGCPKCVQGSYGSRSCAAVYVTQSTLSIERTLFLVKTPKNCYYTPDIRNIWLSHQNPSHHYELS